MENSVFHRRSEKERLVTNKQAFTFNITLAEMFEQTELADTILTCGDRKFPVHKVILCASSPYFRAMFCSGPNESSSGYVTLKGVNPDAFQTILEVMYFHPFKGIHQAKKLSKLLAASHTLQFWCLYEYCCQEYMEKLTDTFFVDIWNTAETYGNEKMLQEIPEQLSQRFDKVKESDDFLLLSLTQIKRLVPFLNDLDYCTDDVVKSLLRWINHDQGRDQYLDELFADVDINGISAAYLSSLLRNDGILKHSVDVLARVMAAAASKLADMIQQPQNSSLNGPKLYVMDHNPKAEASGHLPSSNTLYQCYDIHNKTWSPTMILPSTLLNDKSTMLCYDDLLYTIVNKLGKDCIGETAVFKYHFFSIIPPKECCKLITPRLSAGAVIADGHLYIVGGKTAKGVTLKSVEHYDMQENKCYAEPNMPLATRTRNVVSIASSIYVVDFKQFLIMKFGTLESQWSILQTLTTADYSRLFMSASKNCVSSVASCRGNMYILSEKRIDEWSQSGKYTKSFEMKNSFVAIWGLDEEEKAFSYLYLLGEDKSVSRFNPEQTTVGRLPGFASIEHVRYGGLTACD